MPEVAVFLHADAPEAVMNENTTWYLMIVADSGSERQSIRIGLCLFLKHRSNDVCFKSRFVYICFFKVSNQLAEHLESIGLLLSTSPQSTCWWTPSSQLQGGCYPSIMFWYGYNQSVICDEFEKKGWVSLTFCWTYFWHWWDLNDRGYLPPEAGFVHLAHNYVRHDCPGLRQGPPWLFRFICI